MPFSIPKPGRTKSAHSSWFSSDSQHPAPPSSSSSTTTTKAASPRPPPALNRSASVLERSSASVGQSGDRRSFVLGPSDHFPAFSPDDFGQLVANPSRGLTRSQTVVRREGSGARHGHDGNYLSEISTPFPLWTPDLAQLPATLEQPEPVYDDDDDDGDDDLDADFRSMSAAQLPGLPSGKTSSDSGQPAALDRWSQRRLQRLNTEQGFREQRQGGAPQGGGHLSPAPAADPGVGYNVNSSPPQYPPADAQPHSSLHHSTQPHPAQQSGYQPSRTSQTSQSNLGLAIQTQPSSNPLRSPNFSQHDPSRVQQQPQYSPADSGSQYSSQDNPRPSLAVSRSQSHQGAVDDPMSNNGASKAQRSVVSNRQSIHNGSNARDGSSLSTQGGQLAYNNSVQPPGKQHQGDVGRATPQPLPAGDDMTDEEVAQLVKEHKELREKYTKVKKYYFEKEDQVKQLQNSLAHQRLSQSKTSLDDSEYTTRFNRLDGLVAQLAFSIRKSWKSLPSWLLSSVNKDAIQIGKQEMTAAGRAVISHWLVEEVFDKYFHPDLDPSLSAQLKSIQRNIRRYAPVAQTAEEEEYLTSKTVNWRLATLEGLQEALRSPQCPANRQQLIDLLKNQLCSALAMHLVDPTPSDLEGGVHMIVELVVSIAIHLPLESRDVVIEYFPPGSGIVNEQMKLESGIPTLAMSLTDDAAERASFKSANSDVTDMTEGSNADHSKKRSMLSAITGAGSKSKSSAQGKHYAAGGSSSSLGRPDSSHGKDDAPPRVRMAAGIGVQIRGRSVLVKAPVFST